MVPRPTIGILLDHASDGSFSKRPHYALRNAYFDAIWRAGGLPLGVGYLAGAEESTLEKIQGLLIPGGFYPFPEAYYGDVQGETISGGAVPDIGLADQGPVVAGVVGPGDPPPGRHAAELALLAAALEQRLPVLGICAGMQVIATQAGVRLFKNLRNQVDCAVDHLDEKPAEEPAHAVRVAPGTRLHDILGCDEMWVNTAHNEAPRPPLDDDGKRFAAGDAAAGAVPWPAALVASAVASDGVIEAIERRDQPFCIGVQWHPEFFLDEGDPNLSLFNAFVAAAAD